jgi:4-amino-4-deoxy-L-arabinose transferase-like glycosyltransferase
VKYFFLSQGWTVGRVWASEGLWQITAWRRQPDIQQLNICLVEQNELLWLYRAEEAVLTVEVKPTAPQQVAPIGQVVLKRLMSAEQVIERLGSAETRCHLQNIDLVVK